MSVDGPYFVGTQIRIKGTFALNGTNTDPGSGNVSLSLLSPLGVETNPTPTDDGSGIWHYDMVTTTPSGVWQYRWSSVGAVGAAFQGSFYVPADPF